MVSFIDAFGNPANVLTGGSTPEIDYNILHDYATYNTIVTLAIIGEDEWSSGSYFNNLDFVIFKSGGKDTSEAFSKQVKEARQLEQSWDPTVNFYLEKLSFDQALFGTTSGANKQNIKMSVFEPYSLDQFVRAIRVGARTKTQKEVSELTRFVIKLEWVGYKAGEYSPSKCCAPRFIVASLTGIKAHMGPDGTRYEIEFASANSVAMRADKDTKSSAFVVKGSTVASALQNLVAALNKKEKENNSKDIYEIHLLPKGATSPIAILSGEEESTNPPKSVGDAIFDSDLDTTSGDAQDIFKRLEQQKNLNESTNKVSSNANQVATLTFNHDGNSVMSMINSVLLRSLWYYRKVLEQEQAASQNNVDMYSVSPQVEVLNEDDPITGKRAVKIVYFIKIVERAAIRGTQNKAPVSSDKAIDKIIRVYNYQYTGSNRDIIDLKLSFDQLIGNVIATPIKKPSIDYGNKPNTTISANTPEPNSSWLGLFTFNGSSFLDSALDTETPFGTIRNIFRGGSPSTATNQMGVNTQRNPTAKAGEDYYFNYNNDSGTLQLSMLILGDPLFITSTGQKGAVVGKKTANRYGGTPYITNAGIDIEAFSHFVVVRANTGGDIDPSSGLIQSSGPGASFTGVYSINSITTTITNGQFTQNLVLFRQSYTNANLPSVDTTVNKDTEVKARAE